MAIDNPARRELVFRDLDEIAEDVSLLLERGYRSVGNWNLSQVCNHVSLWATYPMDGFPPAPFPVNAMLWLMKVTIGKKQLRKVLESGAMKEGSPTMPASVLEPDFNTDEEAGIQLAETIDRINSHSGNWHASPLFGTMDKETVTQLTLVHAAHHLSFLIPNQ